MILALLGCSPPVLPTSTWCAEQGQVFGTTWSLKWEAESCEPRVREATLQALETVDAAMSTWRADSELSQIRKGGVVEVSPETIAVVDDALDLAARTGGAFDPTVQPLMEVWGFHSKDRELTRPSDEDLQQALAQVGWTKVKLDHQANTIDAGGTALDLSSIAKGHGVDRAFHAVSALGIQNLMVEIGGEVRVGGNGPRGAWRLGIDAPKQGTAPGSELAAVIRVDNAALATSGNYRNAVEVDGQRVHHTMDPRTGTPAQRDVLSATVLAPSCREADGLATAMMVLGSEAGLKLIEDTPSVEAVLLVAGQKGWTQRTSSGAEPMLER